METQKFRVFNRDRESFLNLEVAVIDTTVTSFKKLLEEVAAQSDTGMWLKPYRGIPLMPGLAPFDLIYLDEQNRVIREVESYPNPNIKPLKTQAASALVLPSHTIFASRAKPLDQLVICAPEEAAEMERQLELLSRPNGPVLVARSAKSLVEEFWGKEGSAPSLSEDRSRQLQLAIQKLNDQDMAESQSGKKDSLKTRFLRWLNPGPSDRRRASRHPLPGLVAYHWTGGAPKAYHLGDISDTGFYLLTDERPYLGTILLMTLQRRDTPGENSGDSIAVQSKVVRWGADGVGLAFVLPRLADSSWAENRTGSWADQKSLEEFLLRLNLPKRRRTAES